MQSLLLGKGCIFGVRPDMNFDKKIYLVQDLGSFSPSCRGHMLLLKGLRAGVENLRFSLSGLGENIWFWEKIEF